METPGSTMRTRSNSAAYSACWTRQIGRNQSTIWTRAARSGHLNDWTKRTNSAQCWGHHGVWG
eukprot:366517-Lingulodinium_polyedra.AAC.1